jgi:hypothetical protein
LKTTYRDSLIRYKNRIFLSMKLAVLAYDHRELEMPANLWIMTNEPTVETLK